MERNNVRCLKMRLLPGKRWARKNPHPLSLFLGRNRTKCKAVVLESVETEDDDFFTMGHTQKGEQTHNLDGTEAEVLFPQESLANKLLAFSTMTGSISRIDMQDC